jgi:hypothetical protein
MKVNKNFTLSSLVFFVLFASNLNAQTLDTNIQGLVIKDYRCDLTRWVEGNLVNRNGEIFNGSIRVKIIDRDNDILWQGVQRVSVGGQNGAKFSVQVAVGTCLAPNKVQITLER